MSKLAGNFTSTIESYSGSVDWLFVIQLKRGVSRESTLGKYNEADDGVPKGDIAISLGKQEDWQVSKNWFKSCP